MLDKKLYMKGITVLIILVILSSSVFASAGNFDKGNAFWKVLIQELRLENSIIKSKLTELTNSILNLQEEKTLLQEEKILLQEENELLKNTIEDLNLEIEVLNSKLNDLNKNPEEDNDVVDPTLTEKLDIEFTYQGEAVNNTFDMNKFEKDIKSLNSFKKIINYIKPETLYNNKVLIHVTLDEDEFTNFKVNFGYTIGEIPSESNTDIIKFIDDYLDIMSNYTLNNKVARLSQFSLIGNQRGRNIWNVYITGSEFENL